MQTEKFSIPVVCDKDPKDYYVFFTYCHNDVWHERKVRGGINRIKDLVDRKKEAEALCKARLLWLQSGWNPVLDPKYEMRTLSGENMVVKMTINEALDLAFKNKTLAKKTRQCYRSNLTYIKQAVKECGWWLLPIAALQRYHVKMIMVKVRTIRNLTGHGYNKYLATFRALLTDLVLDYNALEYNPAEKQKKERVAESDKYRAWTDAEKQKVAKYLFVWNERFYTFLQLLYNTGIRPKEALALQIKDINLNNNEIRIVPVMERENSKTLSVRRVALSKHLIPFLEALHLERYPADYYVFGSPAVSGKGNFCIGSQKKYVCGAMRSDYFIPSLTMIKRDTVTRLFNNVIRNPETGLGIDKYMYGLKHTGAEDKIIAGISLDALRHQYGHKSKLMTEVYAKNVKNVYKAQLVNDAPSWSFVREALAQEEAMEAA